MKYKISERYQGKIRSCEIAINQFHMNVDEIINEYKNIYFPDSKINKGRAFRAIFSNKLTEAQTNYFDAKCNLPHHMDSRTKTEYAIDLILGWLIEDAVVKFLTTNNIDNNLDGNDRYREFLHPRKISTQPDILVRTKNKERLVEIFCDWKSTWRNKGHMDLRDSKYKKLKNKKAILFGISPQTKEGFVLDFSKRKDNFEYEPFIHGYGGKPGYTNKCVREALRPLDKSVQQLLKIII